MRIKEVIKSKGFTLQQIADKLGVSKMAISSRINGNPSVSALQEIADVIGVNIKEFFEDTESQNMNPIYTKDADGKENIIGWLKK